jgi:hypothetical protein
MCLTDARRNNPRGRAPMPLLRLPARPPMAGLTCHLLDASMRLLCPPAPRAHTGVPSALTRAPPYCSARPRLLAKANLYQHLRRTHRPLPCGSRQGALPGSRPVPFLPPRGGASLLTQQDGARHAALSRRAAAALRRRAARVCCGRMAGAALAPWATTHTGSSPCPPEAQDAHSPPCWAPSRPLPRPHAGFSRV